VELGRLRRNQSSMTRTGGKRVQKGSQSGSGKALAFKYYIHDTAAGYVLEMSGPFTESSVAELACCWETAKTSRKGGALTLDLRGLTLVDEGAKVWLASMSHEGARYLPESFMRDAVAGIPGRKAADGSFPAERSFWHRLFARAAQ
jgi:hypothetical protein